RVMVREFDELPDVDAETVADDGKLIGKSDIDITEAILGQLCHLRRLRVGEKQLPCAEGGVEFASEFGAVRSEATDHSIICRHLDHDLARKDTFGAMREVEAIRPSVIKC